MDLHMISERPEIIESGVAVHANRLLSYKIVVDFNLKYVMSYLVSRTVRNRLPFEQKSRIERAFRFRGDP